MLRRISIVDARNIAREFFNVFEISLQLLLLRQPRTTFPILLLRIHQSNGHTIRRLHELPLPRPHILTLF